MKIILFTNEVNGGWMPDYIDQFLGGSEELIVRLAEAFVRYGYIVEVYHTQSDNFIKQQIECAGLLEVERYGVKYFPREAINLNSDLANTILITFKDPAPWVQGASVHRNIHLSSEVERPWNTELINHFVNISQYLQSRNVFVPNEKTHHIPLGVDLNSLDSNREDKEDNTMLYCSSPDRGLFSLLQHWRIIRTHYPHLKLRVAYGLDQLFKIAGDNPSNKHFANTVKHLMKQDGIVYLGQLSKDKIEKEYWKAEYWCLPLNNADSELFCLNAIKARYCDCIPVVNKMGALSNTVGSYIDYVDFANGELKVQKESALYDPKSWDDVVKQYWIPLIDAELQSF